MQVVRLDVGEVGRSNRRSAQKRKHSEFESPSATTGSPSSNGKRESKRNKQVLYVEFDNIDTVCKPIIELLNLQLTSTLHRTVTIKNDDHVKPPEKIAGAFVHFCSSSQTDSVWRACIASHFFQRRFGPVIYMRACPRPNKKIRDETEDEELARILGRTGCFSSHLQLDSCVIVPVTNDTRENILFRGAALSSALNLINEPLYYREGDLSMEQFADQEAHKQESVLKVERVDGAVGLYELDGIKWRKIEFDE